MDKRKIRSTIEEVKDTHEIDIKIEQDEEQE